MTQAASASALAPEAVPYQRVAYPGYAYPNTHPARLEVIGRLFGLRPEHAATARILELGCGEGANALAIAHSLPEAQIVALDAAPDGIEQGRRLAGAAGVDNLQLLVADLGDLDAIAPRGPFDYIVAHGVYSWISPRPRGALLECCRRCLTPHGIAFISYNAYPGSYMRDMARDMLDYHLRGVSEPAERLASARELIEAILAAERPSPYARMLCEHLQRMLAGGDALLFHDDLAPISTPFYFHEFMEHAGAHELQFLSEAVLSDSMMRDVPENVAALIENLPRDVVMREQYLDFFTNRMFRQTLLTHASVPLTRTIDDRSITQCRLATAARRSGERFETGDGCVLNTSDPVVNAAMDELCQVWPESLSFGELAARVSERLGGEPATGDALAHLRPAMLDLYLARIVQLQSCALPACSVAAEKPISSQLARAQWIQGRTVLTTLLGTNHTLDDPLERALLPLLDGTRDRPSLADQLGADPRTVESALTRLAACGLLSA